MNWRHSICDACFAKRKPNIEPFKLRPEFRHPETCCFCGNMHESGIYIREDPQLTLCKGSCVEKEDT